MIVQNQDGSDTAGGDHEHDTGEVGPWDNNTVLSRKSIIGDLTNFLGRCKWLQQSRNSCKLI